jgi:uncharacterized protein (TIGR02453 family)
MVMQSLPVFNGFPKETIDFFKELKRNNNKTWFQEHKKNYEEYVVVPAREFVDAISMRLKEISPYIYAIPKIDKSIFRIYRDIRFSKDKRPFKTHLGIYFWEGSGQKLECSGFYFHIEPPNLLLGVGLHIFPRHIIEEYRKSVVHPTHGEELKRAIEKVRKKGGYTFGGKHYKRVPRGYDPEHKNAELLLHNGLSFAEEGKIPDELFTPEIVDYCYRRFKDMSPIHKWLVDLTERAKS